MDPAAVPEPLTTQLVMPAPSVERTYPEVPPVSGSVKDHVPAAAFGWTVTVPDALPAKAKVPLVVPAIPSVGVALAEIVLAVAAIKKVPAAADVMPMPPLPIGSVPVTPVVKGNPVHDVRVPDDGVPKTGVVSVGLVSVLLVSVSVVARPTSVSVAAGSVSVPDATAVASRMVEPDVVPAINSLPTLPAAPNVFAPVTVSALPSVIAVPDAAGPVSVTPSGMVSVAPVAGAAIETLLILVALATPSVGVISVGEVENTILVDVVPVAPEAV